MSKRTFRLGLLTVAVVGVAVLAGACGSSRAGTRPEIPTAAPADPWYGEVDGLDVQPLIGPGSAYSVEYPKKNWLATIGAESALATFTQKDGEAAVMIERSGLNQALAPEEVTSVFGDIEQDIIRARQPEASDFTARLIDTGDRRLIAVEYARPGIAGSERVRQYSIPIGRTLYRIVCTAPPAAFERYSNTFAHMVASFKVSAESE